MHVFSVLVSQAVLAKLRTTSAINLTLPYRLNGDRRDVPIINQCKSNFVYFRYFSIRLASKSGNRMSDSVSDSNLTLGKASFNQIRAVGSVKIFLLICESFTALPHIFFMKEQFSLYQWRKEFFLTHFPLGTWVTNCNCGCGIQDLRKRVII